MFSNILNLLAGFVVAIISLTGYVGVFFLMLLESCGIPIPSEIILPFSGFLVVSGKINFWGVVIVGTFGNLAGSLLAYGIAWAGGRPLVERFGKYILISKKDLNLADIWFKKYGSGTVFFGRLLPIVRTYISFPAGIAKMDIKKFSFYTFIGALPWSILFAWLGVKLGDNWEAIRNKLHQFDLLILILIICFMVFYILRHIKNNKLTQ